MGGWGQTVATSSYGAMLWFQQWEMTHAGIHDGYQAPKTGMRCTVAPGQTLTGGNSPAARAKPPAGFRRQLTTGTRQWPRNRRYLPPSCRDFFSPDFSPWAKKVELTLITCKYHYFFDSGT